MRFITRGRNSKFIIEPRHNTMVDGQRVDVTGLSVQFINHEMDTEKFQVKYRWSDETRLAVESFFLSHRDLGRGGNLTNWIKLVPYEGAIDVNRDIPDELAHLRAEVAERLGLSTSTTQPATAGQMSCLREISDESGSRLCKNKPMDGEAFCRAHMKAKELV